MGEVIVFIILYLGREQLANWIVDIIRRSRKPL